MKNLNKKNAYLAAFLQTFIVGFSFLFVKLALTAADPLNILAHRFTIAFIVASIPIIFGWIKLNITFKDLLPVLPLSLFYPVLFFAFQTFGLKYVSSSEAGIIQATIPIFTMILASFFLKEYSNRLQKISLILSVSGVLYIFIMKGINIQSTNFVGTVLIILSALASASYNVLARRITKKYKVVDLTYMMTFIGFVSFNIISFLDHSIQGTLNVYFKPFTSPLFVISILYLGILSSLISSLLSNYALSQIEASKMSVFSNLTTLITMLAGVIFLQESLYYFHIIGAVMIIAGVIGTNFLNRKIE